MRIFVTGGTGFIGSHFLSRALRAGHDIVALRRDGARSRIALPCEPNWVNATLDGVPKAALSGCDSLVHFAAAGVDGNASWESCFATNVDQSMRLWIRAADLGIKRFIICGSCFEYGRVGNRYDFIPVEAALEPTGPYHSSKAAASMAAVGLAMDRKLALSVLRPFHVFGEGEHPARFWPSLKAAALAGHDFPMTAGEQIRDFVPVSDVAAAFLRSIEVPQEMGQPKIVNVGSGRPQTLRAFAEYWWRCWGASGRLRIGAVPYRVNEVMRYVPAVAESSET